MMNSVVRKIAANYIYWPGYPLVKNAYITIYSDNQVRVIDTGGRIDEIEGMEFYAGIIVPHFVSANVCLFHEGESLLTILDRLYRQNKSFPLAPAIIESADLRRMSWTSFSVIRQL